MHGMLAFSISELPYTAITIIFIIIAAGIGAFVRRRSRDKCLVDLEGFTSTLEDATGKSIWGRLRVENTGLEFVYPQPHKDADGHDETSYILYKHEYGAIAAVVRYHDQLSEANKTRRENELKRTYHPGSWRKTKRSILNIFRTIRDSVLEIVNLLISQAKKASPAGKVLSSQDKYVTQMQSELVGSVGTSFEPLLEQYIGHKVVLEMTRKDKRTEYCGVLKEYTAEFVEIMDVNYKPTETETPRKADLVIPRRLGAVRHLAE